jgi:phage tail tape-measure protein
MRTMMAVVLLSSAVALSGCATSHDREVAERAAIGAGIGAAAGAGVGAVAGGVGVAEGAAVGAVAGGAIGAATTPSDAGYNTAPLPPPEPAYNTAPVYNNGTYTPTPSSSTRRAGERG